MSIFEALKDLKNAWRLIVRPPRQVYEDDQLGPRRFLVAGRIWRREDFVLVNKRGLKFECSQFKPDNMGVNLQMPVVVYLHGNWGSRRESLWYVAGLLSKNISLFTFDFTGCGVSQGSYISLGHFEKEDLAIVIEYLRGWPDTGPIGIFGRSMGAVTGLLYSDDTRVIEAAVFDSPFASIKRLFVDYAQKELHIPHFICNWAIKLLKKQIQAQFGFDIFTLKPAKCVTRKRADAMFLAAKDDELVPATHCIKIYQAYGGKKDFSLVEGRHNSPRSDIIHTKIVRFFEEKLWGRGQVDMTLKQWISPKSLVRGDNEPMFDFDGHYSEMCRGDDDEVAYESEDEI